MASVQQPAWSKGSRCWLQASGADGWRRGTVAAVRGGTARVALDSPELGEGMGPEVTVPVAALEPANPALLDGIRCVESWAVRVGRLPGRHCGRSAPATSTGLQAHCTAATNRHTSPCPLCSDLTHLSYLNEPGILHVLRQRYGVDSVYTTAGPVLVAVNPFKQLNELYSSEAARRYSQRSSAAEGEAELDPHVFLTADLAFKQVGGGCWLGVVDQRLGAGRQCACPAVLLLHSAVWQAAESCSCPQHGRLHYSPPPQPQSHAAADGGLWPVTERADHRGVGGGQDGDHQDRDALLG